MIYADEYGAGAAMIYCLGLWRLNLCLIFSCYFTEPAASCLIRNKELNCG